MTYEEALLLCALKNPEDDTARLVLADWLDEHEQHERAEFIRVQCELAHIGRCVDECKNRTDYWCAGCELRTRERELLTDARRREWGGIECPACVTGMSYLDGEPVRSDNCPHCAALALAPVVFRRGFVESVTCRLGDVLRAVPTDPKQGVSIAPGGGLTYKTPAPTWTLTDWARDVLNAHPVARWEIVDREPAGLGTGIAQWYSERANLPDETYRLPNVVFEQLENAKRTFPTAYAQGVPVAWCAVYATEAAARDSLAVAVGKVARERHSLPEAKA